MNDLNELIEYAIKFNNQLPRRNRRGIKLKFFINANAPRGGEFDP